jgi:hypothetical protein
VRVAAGAWVCLIAAALGGCRQAQAPPGPPSAEPAAVASPSAVVAVSLASPSARPSPSPLAAASPSPQRSRVPLRVAVVLDPPQPTVGQTFTLTLAITNEGARAAEGVYVSTSGQWDRYTVVSVRPTGVFVRDATGWHFGSPLRIGPRETQSLTVEARADEPSNEQLTFAVRESDPGELP